MARKPRELPKLWVRLPADLHRKLVRLASANQRSLNSEIVRRLEDSIAIESPLSPEVQKTLEGVGEHMSAILEHTLREHFTDLLKILNRKIEEGELP